MAVIDTLEIAEELARDGVFSREQAERLARVSARTASGALVIKADLESAIGLLRKDLESLRIEFDAKLQAVAKDLVKRFAGILLAHGIAVIGVAVALISLL